jgi:ssDNA-binding Zn-finger/Zn-ribbon topoisomerase 1
MKKKHKHEDLYCPECEKVNKKIRLVRDECPECHYQPTRV